MAVNSTGVKRKGLICSSSFHFYTRLFTFPYHCLGISKRFFILKFPSILFALTFRIMTITFVLTFRSKQQGLYYALDQRQQLLY